MNSDVTRRLHTDSHLVAFDPEHRDDDIIADHHGFTHTSRQYQHRIVLHGLPSVFKPLGNETILTGIPPACRSEEHTSDLQSLMRISYAVFCLKKKITQRNYTITSTTHKNGNK